MTFTTALQAALPSIFLILAVMAVVTAIERILPLHARGSAGRAHLGPNLALTFLTFATNAVMNAGLVMALVWVEAEGFGLLRALALPPLWAGAAAIVALDFSFYVTHVAMHKVPAFWRFHCVHHSDVALDVTTTIRQHPGESLIRYASLAAFAIALGASPGAFAIYRAWSAVNGLLEHANLRAPRGLDRALAWLTTWPHMHKVHHSRRAEETDTNYSNVFSVWDRLFGTFTPSERGTTVEFGLDDFDDAALQTIAGLLAAPFLAPQRIGDAEATDR
jgi:sterol desaturase/sphingolipid hydroxylase (fatty acid hydroxylase superfamily)